MCVLEDINLGTALQCLSHSSTMDEGRHSERQKKDEEFQLATLPLLIQHLPGLAWLCYPP